FGFHIEASDGGQPAINENEVVNAFAQDQVAITKAFKVTFGSKAEHDTVAGWAALPSASIMWSAGSQRVWATVSRARRTPASVQLGMRLNFMSIPGESGVPTVLQIRGNPNYKSEQFVDFEAGYRVGIGPAAVDVTTFRGHYDHLATLEPQAPYFETSPQ